MAKNSSSVPACLLTKLSCPVFSTQKSSESIYREKMDEKSCPDSLTNILHLYNLQSEQRANMNINVAKFLVRV